ncbi:MAG: PEP-CTERM sorting domain-containing protein [Candidatus Anammoxibacter sp.]
MRYIFIGIGLLASVLASSFNKSADADLIIQAVSVTSNGGELGPTHPLDDLINQEGLSESYVSGVTDYFTFTSSATHTDPSLENVGGYASLANVNFPVILDFDLGGIFAINKMALWNDTDNQALGEFDIYAATDDTFTSLSLLGMFTGVTQESGTLAQTFTFNSMLTQFIRISANSISPFDTLLNIGEIAFGTGQSQGTGQPVPEPTTVALMGIGIVGLVGAGYRKRRKNKQAEKC